MSDGHQLSARGLAGQRLSRAQTLRAALSRRAVLTATLGLALGASGCGWHPLYERPSPTPNSGGVSAKLAQIKIDPISGQSTPDPLSGSARGLYDARTAQLLQNRLRENLNPYGAPTDTAYHLAVQVDQLSRATVTLRNQQASREELEITAKFQLVDLKGKSLLSDTSRVVTSYDILQEPFSDLQSMNDAVQRGVQELAAQIQTRLSVFLGN